MALPIYDDAWRIHFPDRGYTPRLLAKTSIEAPGWLARLRAMAMRWLR